MRISDWSSDVCSSDLSGDRLCARLHDRRIQVAEAVSGQLPQPRRLSRGLHGGDRPAPVRGDEAPVAPDRRLLVSARRHSNRCVLAIGTSARGAVGARSGCPKLSRSEEHTSELQSLMRISYAVFCLKKKKNNQYHHTTNE